MKQLIYIIGLLCAYSTIASGQSQLTGTVMNQGTDERLPFVNVAIFSQEMLITGAQTDFDGRYVVTNLAAGTYDVVATYVGYHTQRITGVVVEKDSVTVLNIALKSGQEELEEVVIIEYKRPLIKADVSWGGTPNSAAMTKVGKKEISKLAATTAGLSDGNNRTPKVGRGSRALTPYYLDGVRVAASTSSQRHDHGSAEKPNPLAGLLTATEVNDFANWDFWESIHETDFIEYSVQWDMNASKKYAYQFSNMVGQPISGYTVQLQSTEGHVIWQAVTDQHGFVALYDDFIPEQPQVEGALHVVLSHMGEVYHSEPLDEMAAITKAVRVDVSCVDSRGVELAFVIDISGSMRDEMHYLRSDIVSLADHVRARYPDDEVRIGFVLFQGHGDHNTITSLDLTADQEQWTRFLAGNYGGGGNDEAMDLALETSNSNFSWTADARKMTFVLGDEPLQAVPENWARLRQEMMHSAALGIKVIPVHCSGKSKLLEYVMRNMALATGGTFIALTDHSGIGGSHVKPTVEKMEVKTLGEVLREVIARFGDKAVCDPSDMQHAVAVERNTGTMWGEERGITCSPNPGQGHYIIDYGELEPKQMYVTDAAGRLVQVLDREAVEVDLTAYASGTYYLVVDWGEKGRSALALVKT